MDFTIPFKAITGSAPKHGDQWHITIIRNNIEPRIVRKQIGLHPVLTLMSMFVGTHLFGVVGLFGLPILLSLLRYLNDAGTISLFPASALGGAKSEPEESA